MTELTSRERVLFTLDHREPDRVPIDIGGGLCSISQYSYRKLLDHLGWKEEVIIGGLLTQVVTPSPRMMDRLGSDYTHLFAGAPDVRLGKTLEGDLDNPYNENPDQGVRHTFMDEWGVVWRRNAYYYDMVDFPIKGQITHADLEVFPFPNARDPGRIRGLAERAKEAQDSGKAVTLDPLAGGILEMANSLRGHQSFFTDMAANPDLAMYLLDRITGFFEDFYEQALTSAGEYVDVVFFGDDYGMQSGMLISPRMWRKMIKPFLARLIQKIKNTAPVRFQLHSCGAVFPIIEDLVEIGVDILNPLQPSAVGMDLPMIKKKFGDRLVFHGVIDQQEVLPHGTIEEVENEVRSRLGILAPGGGYVVAVSPNIQADVRPQNILALFDSIRKWGSYPIHVV